MIRGDLPIKAQMLIKEWARMYRKELIEMWETQKFIQLKPLE